MAHRTLMQYSPFHYYDLTEFELGPCRSCTNNNNPSIELDWLSCISYRITVLIHVMSRGHVINNWINEQFAVSLCRNIYTHMHGLIFDTSIWLLAGSTRLTNTSSIGLQSYEDALKHHASAITQPCSVLNRNLLTWPLWNHHKHTVHTSMPCAGRSDVVSHSLLHILVATIFYIYIYIYIARQCIHICQH